MNRAHSQFPARRRRSLELSRFACALGLLSLACSSDGGGLSNRRAGPPPEEVPADLLAGDPDGPRPTARDELPEPEPFAVLGVEPAHGSFEGGQLAVIQGYGFGSDVRVWFGDREVPADQVVPARADRVQVNVPPGTPGSVSVTTQNGSDPSTRRALAGAYNYDSFFARPERGPISGGSVITIIGSGTSWDLDTRVAIDGIACELVEVRGGNGAPQELDCRTGASSEGQKNISVTSAGVTATVNGGFVYEPGSVEQGGLAGEPLGSELYVRVVASGGSPIAGAYVILGADYALAELGQAGARVAQTDVAGAATLSGAWTGPQDVTVAAKCYQPLTFVGVPVDTVLAELSPVLSPDCIDQNPSVTGGSSSPPVVVSGELVWRGAVEFQRAGWNNVPAPANENERRAAYILQPGGDPEGVFRLPRESSAVTLDSPGTVGYHFELVTGAGSRTFYAVAGVENRNIEPPRFNAYALGLVRGIFAAPGESVEDVAIAMDRTLDQALTLELTEPGVSSRGPDRLEVRAAVQISESGFVLLPNLRREVALPGATTTIVVGLPALVGALAGGRYVVGARAVTGPGGSLPHSIVPLITAGDTSLPIGVSGFVAAPALSLGSDDQRTWNRQLGVSWTPSGRNVDLIHYDVRSGSGLINWSVAAPASATSIRLPDLSQLPEGDLLPGTLDVVVSLAGLDEFDYSRLTSRQLRRFAWDAYALDAGNTQYEAR